MPFGPKQTVEILGHYSEVQSGSMRKSVEALEASGRSRRHAEASGRPGRGRKGSGRARRGWKGHERGQKRQKGLGK